MHFDATRKWSIITNNSILIHICFLTDHDRYQKCMINALRMTDGLNSWVSKNNWYITFKNLIKPAKNTPIVYEGPAEETDKKYTGIWNGWPISWKNIRFLRGLLIYCMYLSPVKHSLEKLNGRVNSGMMGIIKIALILSIAINEIMEV